MLRKPQVVVESRPDGQWAVQTDTSPRADCLHDRKSEQSAVGASWLKTSKPSW